MRRPMSGHNPANEANEAGIFTAKLSARRTSVGCPDRTLGCGSKPISSANSRANGELLEPVSTFEIEGAASVDFRGDEGAVREQLEGQAQQWRRGLRRKTAVPQSGEKARARRLNKESAAIDGPI